MHIAELKKEVDALKEAVAEIKGKGAEKVFALVVENIERRLSSIEAFLNKEVGFKGGE